MKTKAPAIDSTVKILDLLASADYSLTLTEICSSADIPPASGHRIVNSLLDHQLIAMDPARKKSYCIGSKVFQTAHSIDSRQSIIPFFHPVAEILKNEIHKPVFLNIPVGNKVVVVSNVEPPSNTRMNNHVGNTMPFHICAAGKAILSMYPEETQKRYLNEEIRANRAIASDIKQIVNDLEKAHRLGYSTTQDIAENELTFIAAPILNLRNYPIASISVSIDEPLAQENARSYSQNLIQAARQLSASIA